MNSQKILILTANPSDSARLRLDTEIRDIDAALRQAQRHEAVQLVQRHAVRADDLRRTLLEERPAIVHFVGHAKPTGILVEGSDGRAWEIPGAGLKMLFSVFREDLHCVVLNACYTESQAEALATQIDWVVGMSGEAEDSAAQTFAVAFYEALGNGERIEFAFEFARGAVALNGQTIAPCLHGKPDARPWHLPVPTPPAAASGSVFAQPRQAVQQQTNIAGGVHIGQLLHPKPPDSAVPSPPSLDERRVLEALRKNVTDLVQQRLRQSLHRMVRITLGMAAQPAQIEEPWQRIVLSRTEAARTLPPETPIIEVYQQARQFLLILGEPGGGKTVTLLSLAEALLAQGAMPVVLNLASWARGQKSLSAWMQDELRLSYGVNRALSAPLLQQQRLVPLLDGLDEVATAQRAACVGAINAFVQEYGLTGLVVCCRMEEYRGVARAQKLQLHGAVYLQPLDDTQIGNYLAQFGTRLDGLRSLLTQDTVLQHLARSPLLLNVMSVAYHGIPAAEIAADPAENPEQRRAGLFERYIETMFARRGGKPLYPKAKVLNWLGWLAGRMREHDQSVLHLEGLQPDWGQGKWRYQVGLQVMVGLAIGLAFSLAFGEERGAVIGLAVGVAAGFVVGLTGDIEPEEQLSWSWEQFRYEWKTMLLLGLGLGGGFWLIHGLLGLDLRLGALLGLMIGSLIGLQTAGVSNRAIPNKLRPNQGISASLLNGLRFGWVWIPLMMLISSAVDFMGVAKFNLLAAVAGGALTGFLVFGGTTVLQHYALRLALIWERRTPWRYVRFLDYCARLVLMQKSGGGYVFIHRLVMEHFAAHYDPLRRKKSG